MLTIKTSEALKQLLPWNVGQHVLATPVSTILKLLNCNYFYFKNINPYNCLTVSHFGCSPKLTYTRRTNPMMKCLSSCFPSGSNRADAASSSNPALPHNVNVNPMQPVPPMVVQVGVPQTPVRRPPSSIENALRQSMPQYALTQTTQSRNLSPLPTELWLAITEHTFADNPSMRDVVEIRRTCRVSRESIEYRLRRPESREMALRMTRNSISRLGQPSSLKNTEFQLQVEKLIERNTHIGVNLPGIASPERRQIVLDRLANATGLRTIELDASNMPESFEAVLDATNAVSERNPQLTRFALNVSSNNIGPEGAQALRTNTTITQLNVYLNHIGHAGAHALAANTTITQLDVSFNNIGHAGARALTRNRTITQLDVSENNIGPEGARALAANTTITQLNV